MIISEYYFTVEIFIIVIVMREIVRVCEICCGKFIRKIEIYI